MSKMIDDMVITANKAVKESIDAHAARESYQIKQDFQPRTYGTLWYRWNKDTSGWDFNHLEDGHCKNSKPTQKHPNHANIWKGRWAKAYVQLDHGIKVQPFLVIC